MVSRLIEITEQEWLKVHRSGRSALFVYTPLCGTCKVTERMLQIVSTMEAVKVEIFTININFSPILRESYQIESVPCLLVIQNGIVVRKEYALEGVDRLYQLLRE